MFKHFIKVFFSALVITFGFANFTKAETVIQVVDWQSGVGGIIPNPRKLRADCATKAVENEIIAITSSSGKMFGITCLKKIVKSETLDNLAESLIDFDFAIFVFVFLDRLLMDAGAQNFYE